MEPQRYTPDEQALFERELEQNLRAELPNMREEEIKAAARRAAAREVEQQREVLREDLGDQVTAITEEPADLRRAANREAPSKLLLGLVLLLLLLFTLAVLDRFPWMSAQAFSGRQSAASNDALTAILGDAAASTPAVASPAPQQPVSPSPAMTPSPSPNTATPSPSPVQAAMLPHTGASSTDQFVLDPLFGYAYWENGGVRRFGRPTSNLMLEDGRWLQTFERARFEYRLDHAGTPGAISIIPTTR